MKAFIEEGTERTEITDELVVFTQGRNTTGARLLRAAMEPLEEENV